jgi:hypothetical protein
MIYVVVIFGLSITLTPYYVALHQRRFRLSLGDFTRLLSYTVVAYGCVAFGALTGPLEAVVLEGKVAVTLHDCTWSEENGFVFLASLYNRSSRDILIDFKKSNIALQDTNKNYTDAHFQEEIAKSAINVVAPSQSVFVVEKGKITGVKLTASARSVPDIDKTSANKYKCFIQFPIVLNSDSVGLGGSDWQTESASWNLSVAVEPSARR